MKKLLLSIAVLASLILAGIAFAADSSFSERATAERLKPVGTVCLKGDECADALDEEDEDEDGDDVASEDLSGEDLFNSKGCTACHSVDNKIVGPAFKDVAEKHAGEDDAVDTLSDHIQNGSQGVWGDVAMPPNSVTEDEAEALAEWVLSHN